MAMTPEEFQTLLASRPEEAKAAADWWLAVTAAEEAMREAEEKAAGIWQVDPSEQGEQGEHETPRPEVIKRRTKSVR